jgi:hypothetical protein
MYEFPEKRQADRADALAASSSWFLAEAFVASILINPVLAHNGEQQCRNQMIWIVPMPALVCDRVG